MQTIFTPNDIIDITFILLARRNPMLAGHEVYVPFLIDYLNKQRQKYLDSFHRLIYEQLEKYDRRFRIEPGFEPVSQHVTAIGVIVIISGILLVWKGVKQLNTLTGSLAKD